MITLDLNNLPFVVSNGEYFILPKGSKIIVYGKRSDYFTSARIEETELRDDAIFFRPPTFRFPAQSLDDLLHMVYFSDVQINGSISHLTSLLVQVKICL